MKALINYYSKFHLLKKIFVATAVVSFLFACKKNADIASPDNCSGPAKSFATDVNPIIQASCATGSGYHGSGSNNGPGPLLTYSEIFNARSAISSAVSSGEMTKNGSLTAAEKNAFICWIDNGAVNN